VKLIQDYLKEIQFNTKKLKVLKQESIGSVDDKEKSKDL
jgi:hypothetical protein